MSIILNDQIIAGGGGSGGSGLPDQEGNAGKFLTTDGTDASWANLSEVTGVVVASGINGSTWYRIWSDGFKEMGGVLNSGGGSSSETPWAQPMLTANGTLGGDNFAVYTPNTEYSTNLLWKAFDNSSSTYCQLTATDYVVTIICYNPVPLKLSSFSYLNIISSAAANRTPISGIIYGGNDNLTWTQINDFTNSSTGSGVQWSQAINSSDFYNYYKFEFVLKTQSTTPNLFCMNMALTGTYNSGSGGGTEIVFPYTFSNTNYSFNLGFTGSSGSSIYASSKTSTGITLNSSPTGTCYWSAFGY